MAFANGVSGFFMPEYAEMGTPQSQADFILAAAEAGPGLGQVDRSTHYFAPLNPAPDTIGIRCSPTAKQLARLPQVKKALEAAWRRSNYGKLNAHEEGGWIFAGGSGGLKIVNAPPGTDDHIDLRNVRTPPPSPIQGQGALFGKG
jgi:hypothetical protein